MLDLRKHLGEVQKKIGYYFINKGLLCQAFTRSSHCIFGLFSRLSLLCQAFTRSSHSIQYGTQSNEVPEYILSDEQIYKDGRYSWECTCTIRNYLNTSGNKWIDWIEVPKTIKRTAYALNKKEAKKDAAYQVLCCMFGLQNEY